MIELLAMWKVHAMQIINTRHTLLIFITGIFLSLLIYIFFRRANNIKRKVTLLYSHIFFLFFPFIASALLWNCSMPAYSCSPKLLIYLVSGGTGATLLLSFIALPYLYNWASKSQEIKNGNAKEFVREQSKALGIREPKLYATHEIIPRAYSITNIRPSIFLSVGLYELLDKKELEAVLLHELYHIRKKTSFWKFSVNILKTFYPLASFITINESMSQEEKEADYFAVSIQGTKRFLKTAKHKMNKMNKKIDDYS